MAEALGTSYRDRYATLQRRLHAAGAAQELDALKAEIGALFKHLEQVFPLSDAAKAHELGESGRTTGKIVLSVAGEQEV